MPRIRITKKGLLKLLAAAVLVVVALVAGQCSMASAQTDEESQSIVTVKRLPLTKDGQPRVRITSTKRIDLLFSKPRSDSTVDDLVHQPKGTVTYRLPRARRGTTAKWYVTAYNPRNGHELFDGKFVWHRYKREVVGFSTSPTVGPTDIYAEIHPKKGGKLRVKSVRARLLTRSGTVRWVELVHAYTDEERGVRVYVKTVRRGVTVTRVVARTVYGTLRNVSTNPVEPIPVP